MPHCRLSPRSAKRRRDRSLTSGTARKRASGGGRSSAATTRVSRTRSPTSSRRRCWTPPCGEHAMLQPVSPNPGCRVGPVHPSLGVDPVPLDWLRRRPQHNRCPTCGRPIDAHRRDVRFALPDVLVRPPAGWRGLIGGTESIIEVSGVAGFVRVLLPVRLSADATLTIGTWLRTELDTAQRVNGLFFAPAYATVELDGRLANAIYPWGPDLLDAPAHARVRDPNDIPYVESSGHPLLHRVLTDEWPHEEVFAAFGSALR